MLVACEVERPFVHLAQQNLVSFNQSSQDTYENILKEYEADIKRAANSLASRHNPTISADIAQEVRFRLYRVLKSRGKLPSRYIRRVIANAARTARLNEVRQTINTISLNDNGEALRKQYCSSDLSADLFTRQTVVVWLRTLPKRLQQLFELLYVEGHTQRVVALRLGITQARVAQLHLQLLKRGKRDLAHLVN